MRSEHTTPHEPSETARSGPRHAAERKSLFSKYRLPAGKAAALASMPTAVLLGLTLTPKLAAADDNPVNPYAPGPCVTQSDEPAQEETPKAEETAKAEASPSPSPSASAGSTPEPSASPSQEAQSAPDAGGDASPSPSPTPTESENPLDPLGVGDAIEDLLDGPDEPAPAPTSTQEQPAAPDASGEDTAAGDADTTTADKAEEDIREAAEKAGAEVKELTEDAKSDVAETSESTGSESTTGADGKPRFPCPELDAEALANADLEKGIPLLPDDPWTLNSSRLTLKGLKYHGIVEVKTYSGKVKKVLKFTASKGVDIKDLHQIVIGPGEKLTHVRTPEGTTSTMSNGTVTMYTESLQGNLFGLIPVTFSPEAPPPVDVPLAIFTDVTIKQAGQFGGTLTLHMIQGIE